MLFTLVRHGHAGEKKLWPFDDVNRPLSLRGRQQSEGLISSLAGVPVRRLLSSPYRRCRQTLKPLASTTGLSVQVSDLLGPDARARELDALLRHPDAYGMVLCTHGETLTALLSRWHRNGRVTLPLTGREITKNATRKGAGWLIEDSAGVLAAHYLPPVNVIDLTRAGQIRVSAP